MNDKTSDDSDMTVSSSLTIPADLRPEVVSLARELERLPGGTTYMIEVDKPDLRGLPWRIKIDKTETIRIVDLRR